MKKNEDKTYFLLYSCCIPVKGINRSVICDIQRNSFIYIPNELYDIVTGPPIKMNYITKDLNNALQYIIDEEYAFFTNEPDKFPPLNFNNNDYCDIINSSIIDFNSESRHNISNIVEQLSDLGCSAIEIRFFDTIKIDEIYKILMPFEESTIRSIHFVLKNTDWTTKDILFKLAFENKRITQIIVHSSSEDLTIPIDMQSILIYTKNIIDSECHCGFVSPKYFRSNIDFFKESLTSNNCLNKKISIDKKGYIRNCPAISSSFGNIENTRLSDVVENEVFRKLWNISKNHIKICKNCEFRYICQDCRAFIDETDIYSKPKKCNYDPYNTIWN